MAKYLRRQDLIEVSLAFKMHGKRYCDFDANEKKEYFKERKRISRLRLSERRTDKWDKSKSKKKMLKKEMKS